MAKSDDVRSEPSRDLVDSPAPETATFVTAMLRPFSQKAQAGIIDMVGPLDAPLAHPRAEWLDGLDKLALLDGESADLEADRSPLAQGKQGFQQCVGVLASGEADGDAVSLANHPESRDSFADLAENPFLEVQTSIIGGVNRARLIALDVLCQVETGAFASDLLDEQLKGFDTRDAGLATEIVLGSLRRRSQLDSLIEQGARRAVGGLEPVVRNALRLGVYQLKFLSRIPPHAAVGETVESVRAAGKGHAAGFVNAVLRHVPSPPLRYQDVETRLCLPAWLWDSWRESYGAKEAEAAAVAALSTPEPWFRIPPGVNPPEGAVPGSVAGAYLIEGPPPEGAWRQDIGAQWVAPLLEVQPHQTVLDLCAAPGHKTRQILEAAPGLVVAADASPSRLARLPAAWPRIRLDAGSPLPFRRAFDRILVDAPCSGTGTLARNPEIKWRLGPADIAAHAARQRTILANALAVLKPGGRLVYATCSLERRENEDVVLAVARERVISMATRLPGRDPGDGFFAAVLS